MDNNEISLALYNPQPGTNIVTIRRGMLNMSVDKDALTDNEMLVFKASTTRQFAEYSDVELMKECNDTFDFIASDIGFRKTNPYEWGKIMVRFASILKRYYPTFTIDDIIMAFELLVTGGLDAYLPKDMNGNPAKNHYQQFNVEYLSRILNAYRRERGRVIQKAQSAVPKPQCNVTSREKEFYRKQTRINIIISFLRYKYTGRFDFGSTIGEMLTYNVFADMGYLPIMDVTKAEQDESLNNAYIVTQNKCNFSKIRRKRLICLFDELIEEEIQITDYITLS